MDTKELEEVVRILQENGVTEFEMKKEGVEIKLTRSVTTSAIVGSSIEKNYGDTAKVETSQPSIENTLSEGMHTENNKEKYPSSFVSVDSPIVGTFYRKPSPDSSAFSSEGDTVSKGDTLCIVEAMKLMNEIPAPCDGKIIKILIKDSQVVEYGEPMFIIDPS